MVMVLEAKAAVTPAGRPAGVPMPVAPVVVWVILGLRAELIQTVRVRGPVAVLKGSTVIITGVVQSQSGHGARLIPRL